MGKLIDRIPGSRASFDIKFTRLGFENACWIALQASRCQQAFSKPSCPVNLISKETHLVFSIFTVKEWYWYSINIGYNQERQGRECSLFWYKWILSLIYVSVTLCCTITYYYACLHVYEPRHEISNNVVCATSNGSDQAEHTRSLIRVFASRLTILWVLSY